MAVQVVSFHCVLKNRMGRVIGTTFNHEILISDKDSDQKLKVLSENLKDLKPGEKRKINLSADQAYGFYDPQLVISKNIEHLDISKPLELGEIILYVKDNQKKYYRVIEISNGMITLDGNHPLAGQDLIFEIEATEARKATSEDLTSGEWISGQSFYH